MAIDSKQSGDDDGDPRRPPRARSKIPSKLEVTKRKAAKEQVRRPDRAERVIRFIECLTVPSGVGQGEAFRLRWFQRDFIKDIYEPCDADGRRIVRRAILSLARKNGKTALTASIALAHLIGPEAIENGEIYSAANDREQASIVFRIAAQIVRADPELSEALRVVDSTKRIVNYANGSFYQAISAEHGTKHGFSPSLVIYDELAQAKGRLLYDVLDTSMGARREPLFIVISTQSNDPEHILSRLIDDGLNSDDPSIVCHLFAVPDDCPDVFNPLVWKKANPALNDFRDLADFKALATKAKRMPAEEPKFRNLFLNQRVSPISSLIARAEWMACAGPVDFTDGEPVYLALDLSSVNDLTALLMLSADPKDDRVRPFLWKPRDTLAEHSHRDFGAGNRRYDEWHKDGHLLAEPGRTIDKEIVAKTVAELCGRYKVLGLAYDRWRMDDLLKEFDSIGFRAYQDEGKPGDGLRLVPWGQGFKDMAPAIDALEKSIMERRLKHPSNPALTWNIANAVAVTDASGNRKLDKDAARFRIDGAVALAMCVGLKARDRVVTPEYRVYFI